LGIETVYVARCEGSERMLWVDKLMGIKEKVRAGESKHGA
jgi:hypothetical protein